MSVVYGCCVGDWQKLYAYVIPRIPGRTLYAISGQTSIAVAYNIILDAVRLDPDVDMLILLHDDLEILDPDAEAKFLTAIHSGVALAGVAGASDVKSLAWWEYTTVGHQLTDVGMIDFGLRTGYVDMIEGSIMALSPWTIEHLRFDETYTIWHGYDGDLALQLRQHGMNTVVVDVDTHHHTVTGFKSESSRQQWHQATARFEQKWGQL